jgi:hypothetical protein
LYITMWFAGVAGDGSAVVVYSTWIVPSQLTWARSITRVNSGSDVGGASCSVCASVVEVVVWSVVVVSDVVVDSAVVVVSAIVVDPGTVTRVKGGTVTRVSGGTVTNVNGGSVTSIVGDTVLAVISGRVWPAWADPVIVPAATPPTAPTARPATTKVPRRQRPTWCSSSVMDPPWRRGT